MLALVHSQCKKVRASTYPGGNIVSQGKSESAMTSRLPQATLPYLQVIGVASAGSSLPSPELNELTINGTGTGWSEHASEVLTSGDFYCRACR